MHIEGAKNAANLTCHHRALVKLGDIALRVVLQMKLAALPRHPGEHRLACRLQAAMVVAGDELDTAQAAFKKAVQKRLCRNSEQGAEKGGDGAW